VIVTGIAVPDATLLDLTNVVVVILAFWAWTKLVVAILVSLSVTKGVGACGFPVKIGVASGALSANSPDSTVVGITAAVLVGETPATLPTAVNTDCICTVV
jgi:hypothetical protein